MIEQAVFILSLLASGHVGLSTIFGSSTWDKHNPVSNLACYHRDIDDDHDLVVAHNTLPCGTRVWLFDPRTGKSVIARVADRGPRHAYVDLSRAVARRLGHNGRENILLVPLPDSPEDLARALRLASRSPRKSHHPHPARALARRGHHHKHARPATAADYAAALDAKLRAAAVYLMGGGNASRSSFTESP